MNNKFVGLIILDGWGMKDGGEGNAVQLANPTNFLSYYNNCPSTTLLASGESVGLPEGQIGNSEVGHLNIGAGRIVYQNLLKINNAIKSGEFFKNKQLHSTMQHCVKHNSVLHLMGLLSDGGVHSHINHLFALIDMAHSIGVKKVSVHAFLDGRDTYREKGVEYLQSLLSKLSQYPGYCLSSVVGRYYAMDREQNYNYTKMVYDMIVEGVAPTTTNDVIASVKESYAKGIFDEFVKPIIVDSPYANGIKENDAIIHFNFREDRGRQLTSALVENFEHFNTKKLVNVPMCTFISFDERFKNPIIAFPVENIKDNISAILSKAGLKQFRISETTKYAHVTYFMNGGIEKAYKNEDRFLIETIKGVPFEEVPEMRANEITDLAIEKILSKKYDFMALNYSNTDMIGHTGNIDAAIKTIQCVDKNLKKLIDAILSVGGCALIIADHGNVEEMREGDKVLTDHTTNPVPCILVGVEGVQLEKGVLANVSPTILDLFDIPCPKSFTHKSLIKKA